MATPTLVQDLFIPSMIILATIFLFLKLTTPSNSSTKKEKLPPGPRPLPVIGNLHQLITDQPHRRLRDLARKHGPDMMHLRLGELSYVVVSSADAAQAVMKDHDLSFASRPYILAADIVFYGTKDIALAPYSAYWKKMRKICVVELLSSKRVLSFRPVREAAASKLEAVVSRGLGQSVDMGRLLRSTAGGLTYKAAFGMAEDEKSSAFGELLVETAVVLGGFSLSDLFPSLKFLPALTGYRSRLERLHLAADEMIEEIIDAHKVRRSTSSSSAGGGSSDCDTAKDLVDILLNLQEKEHDMEIPLTTDGIKAVIFDMFFGGTDTGSTTVEWAMAELIRNPRVMQKTQEEIRNIFNSKESTVIDEESLDGLEYLDCVIQETLRLHPPLPLLGPREARERVDIIDDTYHIASGTKLLVNVWAIGRDPRYWDEPEEFRPERFMGCRTGYWGTDFKFTPFGAGRRMCPGISFAMAVVRLFLSNLLYHFDWRLPANVVPEGLDMDDAFGMTMRRKTSLCLVPSSYHAMCTK